MSYRITVVIICSMIGSWVMAADVRLELRSARAKQVMFESEELHLFLVNQSGASISVAPGTGTYGKLQIEHAAGWANCLIAMYLTPGVGELASRRRAIASASEIPFTLIASSSA